MDVYEVLKPLHFIANCFGLIPFRLYQDDKHEKCYRFSKLGLFRCACFWIFYAGYYIHIFITNRKGNEGTHILNTIFKEVFFILVSLTILISLIINCKKQYWITEALNRIAEVDRDLNNIGRPPNHKFHRNCITVYVILTVLTVMVSEYLECSMILFSTEIVTGPCYFLCFFTFSMKSMGRTLFISYILLLKDRLRIVNEELTMMSTLGCPRRSKPTMIIYVRSAIEENNTLKMIRKLHWKLCSLCKMINEYFSFQLLLFLGLTFMEFTNFAYQCIQNVQNIIVGKFDMKSSIMLFVMPISSIGSMIFLCIICTILKNEVHRTGDILFQVQNKYDSSVMKEINKFARQILQWNVKMSAFDFFDIDMTLVYEAITTATTYLFIIIQIEAAK